MSQKLVVGNWKMFGSRAMAAELLQLLRDANLPSVVCPPYPYLLMAADLLAGSAVKVGAQGLEYRDEGAYTGEVSGPMLRDVGCSHVIVGHSERRALYGENDALVVEKVRAALRHGLTPVVCVGEHLEQRQRGLAKRVVLDQLNAVINGIGAESFARVLVAYEPVWAIGSGVAATLDDVAEMHVAMRAALRDANCDGVALLYGGSVKPDNAGQLLSLHAVDGVLVGGASLVADSFLRICSAAK